jgi:hypothetical protein
MLPNLKQHGALYPSLAHSKMIFEGVVIAAVVTGIFGLIDSVIQTRKNRKENKADHDTVMQEISKMGKNLGRSIDRVEKGVERTEKKIDSHIADHARGEFTKNV